MYDYDDLVSNASPRDKFILMLLDRIEILESKLYEQKQQLYMESSNRKIQTC